ncbi:PIN-like domain-containing protein [Micromonospora sp. WMMD987]|uniref:PIN-like domain-containing protein n=1 Tax=Micromonospora sp. WMMD987 TaxID=3016089 RepID=UPI002499B935|nr:PIN-like domain-containing protein [Micromonospora sp. WMMD987]WFE92733.1 PIN-like domain-containing protein [Micromonospora sp. WMMD987]
MTDGFEGYVTPTPEEYAEVLRTGLVVLDANVLLNLYRYTEALRNDLLAVMSSLADRLWIPHQVLTEFWRNRDRVLRDPRETAKTAVELQKIRGQAVSVVQSWVNRVALKPEQASVIIKGLTEGFDSVLASVGELNDTVAIDAARDTNKDMALASLNMILRGKVGEPLSEDKLAAALIEAQRRIDEKVPPGYMDRKKDSAEGAGDYLIWEQTLIEVERRRVNVLFVTGDAKEDWWRGEGGERRGPRVELVDELRERAGVRLFMVRPAQLLAYASEILSVSIQEDSVQDADRVDTFLAEPEPYMEHGGWNQEALNYLLSRLVDEAPSQALVLVQAANQGGYVTRSQVFEVANYPEERSLRGFTRPFNRIAQLMREEGRLPEQAVDLFRAVYNEDSPAVGVAAGFQIHDDVLPLFLRRIRERVPEAEDD